MNNFHAASHEAWFSALLCALSVLVLQYENCFTKLIDKDTANSQRTICSDSVFSTGLNGTKNEQVHTVK